MRSRQLACLVFPIVAIVFSGTARGDVVAHYSFTDVTAGTLNRDATTVAANVTAGSITDAPIVFTHPMVVLSRTTGVGYATQPVLSAARAAFNESFVRDNVYFTFNVAANAGNELNLSNLMFGVARGGAATPRDYDIRTSLDGFATSLTGIVEITSERPTFTPVSLDLSGAAFQHLTSLTFQFRFFTPGFSQNVDFDDITLNGTVGGGGGLTGDYNVDGKVDAADYVVWRDDPVAFGPNGYDIWRANFGRPGSSSGLGATAAVPEPASLLLAVTAIGLFLCGRRR